MMLSKKEKRALHTLISGLTVGHRKGAFMRSITLTTELGVKKDINKSFDALKMRILRAKYDKDGFWGFRFNRYFKLKTAEGPEQQVLHIVYWGRYIPQEWLSNAWNEIHQSPIVHIRATERNGVEGIVNYLLLNYFTKQPIIRMSYGWKWTWLGFCKTYKTINKKVGLLRRSGKLSDKCIYTDCIKHYTVEHFWGRIVSFKYRYRNGTPAYWQRLLSDPLPTSRQQKFCNPSHERYNRRFFT